MVNNPYTTTQNGALQYSSSMDKCVDLFSKIGSMRHWKRNDILEYFENAFNENPELATQISYWARAAREGSGERKTFYTILDEIARTSPNFISDNARTLAELGYWKDLLRYFNIPKVISAFAQAIKSGDRLANKWAPRKGPNAKLLRDELGFTNKEYRTWLKEHSDTVETKMSESQWDDIEYSSVPGSAMRRYGGAFDRNDGQRFVDWKNDKNSKASVSATYPHQIYGVMEHDEALADKLWNSLPDLVANDERILPMIDVSGSMFGKPLEVAIALGWYLAERNKSEFKGCFLTFSESPKLVRIKDDLNKMTLAEKFSRIGHEDWGLNTDFEKAYIRILDQAVKHNVARNSMPTMLLVLSDMQFDQSQGSNWGSSVSKPHFESMKEKYELAGYDFPKLVFWDLNAHMGSPVQCSDENVAMVSGFSPKIMEAVLNAKDFNPQDVMLEALSSIDLDYTNLDHKIKINYQSEDY
jgi:hypothetical protein